MAEQIRYDQIQAGLAELNDEALTDLANQHGISAPLPTQDGLTPEQRGQIIGQFQALVAGRSINDGLGPLASLPAVPLNQAFATRLYGEITGRIDRGAFGEVRPIPAAIEVTTYDQNALPLTDAPFIGAHGLIDGVESLPERTLLPTADGQLPGLPTGNFGVFLPDLTTIRLVQSLYEAPESDLSTLPTRFVVSFTLNNDVRMIANMKRGKRGRSLSLDARAQPPFYLVFRHEGRWQRLTPERTQNLSRRAGRAGQIDLFFGDLQLQIAPTFTYPTEGARSRIVAFRVLAAAQEAPPATEAQIAYGSRILASYLERMNALASTVVSEPVSNQTYFRVFNLQLAGNEYQIEVRLQVTERGAFAFAGFGYDSPNFLLRPTNRLIGAPEARVEQIADGRLVVFIGRRARYLLELTNAGLPQITPLLNYAWIQQRWARYQIPVTNPAGVITNPRGPVSGHFSPLAAIGALDGSLTPSRDQLTQPGGVVVRVELPSNFDSVNSQFGISGNYYNPDVQPISLLLRVALRGEALVIELLSETEIDKMIRDFPTYRTNHFFHQENADINLMTSHWPDSTSADTPVNPGALASLEIRVMFRDNYVLATGEARPFAALSFGAEQLRLLLEEGRFEPATVFTLMAPHPTNNLEFSHRRGIHLDTTVGVDALMQLRDQFNPRSRLYQRLNTLIQNGDPTAFDLAVARDAGWIVFQLRQRGFISLEEGIDSQIFALTRTLQIIHWAHLMGLRAVGEGEFVFSGTLASELEQTMGLEAFAKISNLRMTFDFNPTRSFQGPDLALRVHFLIPAEMDSSSGEISSLLDPVFLTFLPAISGQVQRFHRVRDIIFFVARSRYTPWAYPIRAVLQSPAAGAFTIAIQEMYRERISDFLESAPSVASALEGNPQAFLLGVFLYETRPAVGLMAQIHLVMNALAVGEDQQHHLANLALLWRILNMGEDERYIRARTYFIGLVQEHLHDLMLGSWMHDQQTQNDLWQMFLEMADVNPAFATELRATINRLMLGSSNAVKGYLAQRVNATRPTLLQRIYGSEVTADLRATASRNLTFASGSRAASQASQQQAVLSFGLLSLTLFKDVALPQNAFQVYQAAFSRRAARRQAFAVCQREALQVLLNNLQIRHPHIYRSVILTNPQIAAYYGLQRVGPSRSTRALLVRRRSLPRLPG